MRTGCNTDSAAGKTASLSRRYAGYLKPMPGIVGRILLGLLLWFSFIKLPTTANLKWGPQSWEAILSYAVPRHLQWGRDIVFSYGPLGFLTSDYYWGNHFGLILFWSLGFSLLLTILISRYLERVSLPVRIILYAALPWLTVPHCTDLGVDPIYLFAITVVGVACFPGERVGAVWLVVLGMTLGLLGLIKFTFFLYCVLALLAITAAHLLHRCPWPALVVVGSSAFSFLAAWLLAGQNISNIRLWFRGSLQIVTGYSSAMSIPPSDSDLVLGILVCLCLIGMLLFPWHGTREILAHTPKICLFAAGIFLAWKEGFVRADDFHVAVFLLYAFFMAATMPALLGVTRERRFRLLPLTVATMAFSLAPFAMQERSFVAAIKAGTVPRFTDTFVALFRPPEFKRRLEANLESRRQLFLLPRITATVGKAPVGMLVTYDQNVAILNGLNYRPHPVFLNYSAYTPELQCLNSAFFDSAEAPEYVIWRYNVLDQRFPTLDDSQIILRMLASYLPVTKEGEYVLWKRKTPHDQGYTLVGRKEVNGLRDQWVPIPTYATWLRVELHETWFEAVRKFFYRASLPAIEVRLEDGQTAIYYLPPGNALSGFVVNPLLDSGASLVLPVLQKAPPRRAIALRVYWRKWCYHDPIRFVMQKIDGIPALRCEPDTNQAPTIPAPSPATAP